MLEQKTIQSEKGIRDLIARNLRKEIHPGTKPSVDFIKQILDEAYDSGMNYNVKDLQPRIMAFANNSNNQALACLKAVQSMKFMGQDVTGDNEAPGPALPDQPKLDDDRLVIFDVEVYPNLFVVCWKYKGAPEDSVVRMINPKAEDVAGLFKLKLVGFNNRKYDNHILYAASMGYDNKALYELSQKLIDNDKHGPFGAAYNISHADIYDFSSKKQSLKKFQIELGVHHLEMDLPWDEPVAPEMVDKVVDYCANDVVSTEVVLEDRWQDYVARQILADLSGLAVNDGILRHTAKIIFGNDREPQKKFVYTDLATGLPK